MKTPEELAEKYPELRIENQPQGIPETQLMMEGLELIQKAEILRDRIEKYEHSQAIIMEILDKGVGPGQADFIGLIHLAGIAWIKAHLEKKATKKEQAFKRIASSNIYH